MDFLLNVYLASAAIVLPISLHVLWTGLRRGDGLDLTAAFFLLVLALMPVLNTSAAVMLVAGAIERLRGGSDA